MRVYDRAALAERMGLGGKAWETLRDSDISAFGPQGMVLELKLLLRTGRVKEIREWTEPGQKTFLGASYHWVRAQALAATGDYALAGDECSELAAGGREPGAASPRQVLAAVVGQAVVNEPLTGGSVGHALWQIQPRMDFRARVAAIAATIRQEANAIVLRGLLALEAGEVELAADDFRSALAVWGGPDAVASGAGIDFEGRVVAQGCLGWLSEE
jgi:hypothetical protein